MVKGDLIIPVSDRIMTRSKAKQSKSCDLFREMGIFLEQADSSMAPFYRETIIDSGVVGRYRGTKRPSPNPLSCIFLDELLHPFLTTSDPDQFTIIPAPLKIIKVLIEELLSASGVQNAANQVAAAAEYADDEGDDDGWEDVPNILDLGSGATKEQLMAFGDGSASFMRQRDDETQAYLTEFFLKAANEDTAGFNEIYGALTEGERLKLVELANK